jgi:hypothetical protein
MQRCEVWNSRQKTVLSLRSNFVVAAAVPETTVHLSFHGVKNIAEVRSFIEVVSERAKGRARLAEIIGIVRDDDRRFLMDLDQGPLYINARSFMET